MVVFFSIETIVKNGVQFKGAFPLERVALNDVVFFREEPTLSAQNSKKNSG